VANHSVQDLPHGERKPKYVGTFSSTAIEIIKWVEKFAVAQAKVTH
jgi:hypothetical protein